MPKFTQDPESFPWLPVIFAYLGCGLKMRTNSGEFTFLMWNRKDIDRGVPPMITASEKAKAGNR